jgi:hypothetical protein
MGIRQNQLKELLGEHGAVSDSTLRFPKSDDISVCAHKHEIERVYRSLGGLLSTVPPLKLRRWDMEFEQIAVELDEELHFNQYRAITLDSMCYKELRSFPLKLYRQYCSEHAAECKKAGGFGRRWSNKSCVSQFGPGSPPRELNGSGSPRWKQRAFYDFVKDLSPLLINVHVARLAIWDALIEGGRTRTLGEILLRPSIASGAAVAELIRKRAG